MEADRMASSGRAPCIAVIGGGIAGLSAAYRLHELAAARQRPIEIAVFEAGDRLGGPLETIRRDGFVIDTGADSFLSEKPWALQLVRRLGLTDEVVATQQQFRKTYVVRKGRLTEIPEGFSLLAPSLIRPVLSSSLFSMRGKLRIILERLIPRRRQQGDESLARFVRRRLGREVLERVAQPLAGGIYTADPETLSIAATMPRFVEMERRYGSLIKGLRAAALDLPDEVKTTSGARWSLFVSFKGGINAIVDELAAQLAPSIHRRARVVALDRHPDHANSTRRWRIRFADGAEYDADALVCATPAYALAPLLEPHNAQIGAALAAVRYASAATVAMAFRASDFPRLPRSFGFVVPIVERRRIIAGSFSSLKFAGRAPDGMILARVFIGGALQTNMMALDEDAMITVAREEFAALLGVTAKPALVCVRRWPDAMPQYEVGHLDRVAAIEQEAAQLQGCAIAGAFLRGVGIPDCVRSGELAADTVFSSIAPSG
jgi:protoporphyrinogen/coproporphyrinogen III oxidase